MTKSIQLLIKNVSGTKRLNPKKLSQYLCTHRHVARIMLNLHEIKHYNYTKNYCIYRNLYFMDLFNYLNE